MKAIIPVAGIGSKLRPHTHTQPKALVPVAGKPILGHIVDALVKAGIDDFVFITGYLGDKIEAYIRSAYKNLRISFVTQEPREGVGHAVLLTKHEIEGEKEILIMLGDTIINSDLKKFLQHSETLLGVKKVDKPGLFGVVETDRETHVVRLTEKPKIPKSNLALVGIYKISEPTRLIEALEYLVKNSVKNHGEYQLTDALMRMIEQGIPMKTVEVENWYDCGRKESLLEANAILLNKPEFKTVEREEFPDTVIIPPVSIGKNCRISSSVIGPFVAVGDHSCINKSVLENTIIGSYSELENVVLERSVIGNDASLKGLSQSFNIGDSTEINLGNKDS